MTKVLDAVECSALNCAVMDASDDNTVLRVYWQYSGRAMYGDTCVGVTSDRGPVNLLRLAWYLAINSDGDTSFLETLAFADMRTDSMGLGQVVYWPGVKADDDWVESNVDPEYS